MKKIALICLLLFTNSLLFAQISINSWNKAVTNGNNFYSITTAYDHYLKTNFSDSLPKEKLSEIKNYYRFLNFWKSRLGVENSITNYDDYFRNLAAISGFCYEEDSANWEVMGPSELPDQYLGLVQQVLYDPENPEISILSTEHGGLWKQQVSGASWKNVTDDIRLPGISATEIIRNPFIHDHLLATTASGIFFMAQNYGQGIIESFDNGETWQVMESFPNANHAAMTKIIADPNDTIPDDGLTLYVIGGNKLYKSENTGINWSIMTDLPPLNNFNTMLDLEIADNGFIYLSTFCLYSHNAQVFLYHEGYWEDISSLFPKFQRMKLTKPFGGKIFCFIDDIDFTRKVYKTSDYGQTWQLLGTVIGPCEKKEIEYSPASGIVYLGIVDLNYFREDDFDSLKKFNTGHVDVRDIVFMGTDADSNENLLIANDGGVSHVKVNINDLSASYSNLNGNHLPIEELLGLGVSHDQDEFIVAGAVHNFTFRQNNGIWEMFSCGDGTETEDGGDCEVNPENPGIYYYQGNKNMRNNKGTFKYEENDWFIGMEFKFNPNDPYTVYAGRNNSHLLIIHEQRSPEDEPTSYEIKNVPSEIDKVGAIGINKNNVIFLAHFEGRSGTTPNRFIKSLDKGNTWIDLSEKSVYKNINGNWEFHSTLGNLLSWKAIEDIVCVPDNANEMYISIGGSLSAGTNGFMRVLRSEDGGESWYDYSENLSPFPVVALEYQSGSDHRLFAGTDAGVFYRDPSTSGWQCFSNGLPVCIITDLDYNPANNTLYASTYGRSIFRTIVPFDDENAVQILPEVNTKIWPNPVTDYLNIQLTCHSTDEIKISLTTINGKLMKETEYKSLPGLNQFTIATEDLNAGVYCLTIICKKFVIHKKIIIQ